MRIVLIIPVCTLCLLTSCISESNEKEKSFDKDNNYLLIPIANVIDNDNDSSIKLDYINAIYPGSIVCFHSQYSSSTINRDKIKKYGIINELVQVPSARGYPENRMGMSIIHGNKQYNFEIPVVSSQYFDEFSPCARSLGAVLKKEKNYGIRIFEE
ncbi:hypothetical protein ACFOWX_03345 [Sphingorhabdus arenilitoris]|uniref:Lipoprotein n=1 Tax=Sphingorhabdus arenilitoris TaxID=1490041 RepID=A0ABV8RG43_9SPHN